MSDRVQNPAPDVRVCIVSYFFDPVKGGGAKQYLGYFPGLQARGIQLEIFNGTPKASKIWDGDTETDWIRLAPGDALPPAELAGVPARGLRLPDGEGRERNAMFFRAAIADFADPAKRPDVINLMPTLTRDTLPWVRELRQLGVPISYTLSLAPPIPKGLVAGGLRRRMLRKHYEAMDAVIVQSLPHEQWLRSIGYRGRVELIPNGVDTQRFRPAADAAERARLREKLGFAADDPILVTVGAVSPRKGTDHMIEAMLHLKDAQPNARLVVLGWRTDEARQKLEGFRRKVADLLGDPQIADRVRIEGVVDNVDEYLRAADLYLFASDREGFPNSLLEAMASGLPVVTTHFVGLGDELGEAGRHYLLAERTPETLAAAAGEVLEKPALREQLSRDGLAWMHETMRMDATLDKFAALYRSLAGKQQRV